MTIPASISDQSDPVTVEAELGSPKEVFGTITGNVVAHLIVGWTGVLLAIGGFIGMIVWLAAHGFNIQAGKAPKNAPDWQSVIVLTMSLFSLLCLGSIRIALWRPDLGVRILVYEGGIIHIRGNRVMVFRWNEIASIVQDGKGSARSDSGPALPRIARLTVQRADGQEFQIDQSVLRSARKLARLLHVEAQPRGIPWIVLPN